MGSTASTPDDAVGGLEGLNGVHWDSDGDADKRPVKEENVMSQGVLGGQSRPVVFKSVVVSSTAVDAVIPSRGQTLRYQQLLLEPSESAVIHISAKGPRRK